ncbi:unnamed protein product [Tilletia laevis]|uniref:Rab-GAP TBC domain-containing protein n=3 Tax=Tilletia TaxID=13289 RepID=A0A8X7SYM8_9BASI|nr:hypothetical protein CF336_g2022 [Tilletia laevis]KAE8203054.1 hypothetical protein CF328_g1859 [Tilletia controversa]CAD6893623.1 unnamed protein product [Tilletia caries]KAE8207173.1 hypothetical protein CF335_g1334 [Tilletia laevis]KAE8252217.1 hypothetical protein A4X06_0g2344 [Tilletia controversa]
MDAHTLTAWTRFALQKGGIGSCTALIDNPATEPEDLMFMTGEKIIVLRRLDEEGTDGEQRASTTDSNSWFLGYCEGVVGRFKGAHVQFHGKLKKPVLMRRSGASSSGHGHNSALFPGAGVLPTPSSSSVTASSNSMPTSPLRSNTADGRLLADPSATPARNGSGFGSNLAAGGAMSQEQSEPLNDVTAPLAIRRPFRTANGALQTQAARRMDLTTPPLSDDNHSNPSIDTLIRSPLPPRSNTLMANNAADKGRAQPSADVQAAGDSFRRRVTDALLVEDDGNDSDDSASVLPWARGAAQGDDGDSHPDDASEDDEYGLSRSAPASTHKGVRTPEHAHAPNSRLGAGGMAAPDLPTSSIHLQLQSQSQRATPVKGQGLMNEQQRSLAKLTTSGLPPSPISSADSPSARTPHDGVAASTPTQLRAAAQSGGGGIPQRRQPQMSESGMYTIAAQSSASSRSSATAESENDEEEDLYDEDELRSESAGSYASASDSLSGSGHGAPHSGSHKNGNGNRLNPPSTARNPQRRVARGARGGAADGRDYAFSIYDLYGRDSVAFPNFEMHKDANRAILALANLDANGHGNGNLEVMNGSSPSEGRVSPGAESIRTDGGYRSASATGGRPQVRTPLGHRPMNPPPVATPSVAAAAAAAVQQQQQEQAARTLHLRSLSQKRPNQAPDPRKGSLSGIGPVEGTPLSPVTGTVGPNGMPTKSLASSLRRQVEGASPSNGSPTGVSSPTIGHGGNFILPPPGPNGTAAFDPHRRPSAPAAVVNGAAIGAGGPRPPMPGPPGSVGMASSFSGPSSGPRGMMPPHGEDLSQSANGAPASAGGSSLDSLTASLAYASSRKSLTPSLAPSNGMRGPSPGPGQGPGPMQMQMQPGGMPISPNGFPFPGPGQGLTPGQPMPMMGGPGRMAGGSMPPGFPMNGQGSSPNGSMLARTPSPMAPGGPMQSPAFPPMSPGMMPMQLNGMMAGGSGARGSGGPVRASSDRTPDRESGRGSALLRKNPSNPHPGSRGSQMSMAPVSGNGPMPGWNGSMPPAPGPGFAPPLPPPGQMGNLAAPSMLGGPSRSPSPLSVGGGGMRSAAPSMRSVVPEGNPADASAAPAGPPLAFDAAGFILGTQPKIPGITPVPESRDVIDKWDAILREGDLVAAKKSRKVKKMCQAGIPASMRAPVWLFLSNSAIRRRPGLFEQLCKTSQEKKSRKGNETVFEQIEKDVERCYPDHRLFIGKESAGRKDLEAILKAYALYNPTVGYTQGMGMVVGLFLMYMPAEDAFWLLCALLRDVHMEGYYTDTMKQLHVDGLVFGQVLQSMDPEVHARLTKWGIEPINYVPNWFLPMFSKILPSQTMMRVWDTFFFEGPIWIVQVSLAIIRIIREPLMACKDYDAAITLLLHPPPEALTPDNVLGCALSVKLKDGEVRKLQRTASKLVRQSNALTDRGRSASRAGDRNSISARSMSVPAKR